MGASIQLPVSQVNLSPRSYEVVPFTITTPLRATPGDHVGGIVLAPTEGAPSTSGNVHVSIINAVGVHVYGRVQGKLVPDLSVTTLSISAHSSLATQFGGAASSTVKVTVSNTGNVRLASTATIFRCHHSSVSSAGAKVVKVPELLPQNAVTFNVPFKSVIPFGQLSATVHIASPRGRHDGNRQAPRHSMDYLLLLIGLLVVRRLALVATPAKLGARGRPDRLAGECQSRRCRNVDVGGIGTGRYRGRRFFGGSGRRCSRS